MPKLVPSDIHRSPFATFKYTLPFPPSVNHYWDSQIIGGGNKRRIHKFIAKAGTAFRKEAAKLIKRRPGTRRRLEATLILCRGDRIEYDVDNFSKGVWDALQHCGVFQKDSQIDRLVVERGDVVEKPGCCLVTIREIGYAKQTVSTAN